MAFPSWEAGELPLEPTGFPLADWARLVGDIPTLGRGVTLAMPCVGLDALSAAMAELRWPGPYEVKYAFDTDPEIAIPLWRLHGPPLPGGIFKIGPTGDITEEDISQWDRVDGTVSQTQKTPEQRCMSESPTSSLITVGDIVSLHHSAGARHGGSAIHRSL